MRLRIFQTAIYSGLVILALGLFNVQVIQGRHFRELGEKNRIRLIPLEAPRGRIFDGFGNLLATNRASYNVVATPEDITEEAIQVLSRLVSLPVGEIKRRLKAPREYPFAPSVILEDIDKELMFRIEEEKPELPGVNIQTSFIRHYPYGETASHLVGYIGKISSAEYFNSDRERYGMNSLTGKYGIEKIYDEDLRGWRGGKQIEVNARGQLIQVLNEKTPVAGKDLTVTIDLEFQKTIMDLIKGKTAAVAVLDLKSEKLLALASSPAFDPNIFVMPGYGKERLDALHSKRFPLLDRSVNSAYPPGSIFKLVTAIAALETGKIQPQTRFYCNGKFRLGRSGRAYHCWNENGHGSLNLYEALERSCNVYFYNLGARLTPEEIAKYARMFGFGERMQLEVMQMTPGLVPDTVWKKDRFHDKWYQGETLSFAIGQSYLLVSPIQILKMVATIAKDGQIIEPKIIREESEVPKEGKVAVKKETLAVIRKAMLQVVQSPYGTGQLARLDFNKMAAKTGTAQAPPNDPHAWMTGFFPYQDPEIVFVVFVEHGGSGGITSAGIVKKMFEIWHSRKEKKEPSEDHAEKMAR